MDEFRKIIEQRKKVFIFFVLGIVVLNGILFFLDNQYSLISEQVESGISFLIGMLVGVSFLALFLIYEYAKALKDDQRLKKLYIDEHDERKELIKSKMSQSTVVMSIVLLMIGINVSIYFNPIIAMTLICTFFLFIVVILIFKVYYSRKY